MSPWRAQRWRPALDVAIPGLYAWIITVAVPVQQKEAYGWPLGFCCCALICLAITGGMLSSRWQHWSSVTAACFVGCSASVWFLLEPFEATLGFLGSLGWAGFAAGWVRAVETARDVDGRNAHRVELLPRHRASTLAGVMVGIGLLGAMLLVALAWQIEGRERALLGHAVAVFGALSLLVSAANSASVLGRQAATRAFSRMQAGRTIALVGLLAIGCWLTFLRS